MLKAPVKQTATDTISTLSSRLSSATLLEDRRASILGLRSFAKQYPATVASGSLRDLIGCLRADGLGLARGGDGNEGGDVDTVRLVLETLLMLFEPDPNSPEASEDIALWLADEFSQRQDNITILLDLLDQPDYYARIYSLHLLTAISAARPERTQECILQAPLGTARLTSVLDDARDAVRNAALLLLVDLTNVSQTELQKLIAFEDAFQRIFNFIHAEGGLAEGGIVVQDCLTLLANLIRHSSSNQALFRESGCIPRLLDLVRQAVIPLDDENNFSRENREKNAWGLLAVLRLFLERGEVGTKQNQDVFWRGGLVQSVLRLAFDYTATPPIRTSALRTCQDMIVNNPQLQEAFASLQVPHEAQPPPPPPISNGVRKSNDPVMTYVIEALLDLVLNPNAGRPLEMRSAGCGLIKAYFSGHQLIKHHFLQRAIAGYTEGEEESVNILSTLLNGPQGPATTDPVRFAFASDITCQLLSDEAEAKAMLMSVSEGDADKGEDVITAIQTLSGHLLSCIQSDLDPLISISYLNTLIVFLFDDPAAINDCLAEGSSLMGALINAAGLSSNSQVAADPIKSLLPGLSAFLLGTIYEFSTKDSPIPRRTLHPLLLSKLGRQKYFEALASFRAHPIVRDSELLASSPVAESDFGAILFDPSFIAWTKDEYGRLRRAIDREPGIEVIRQSDVGVDRDILDDLREQLAAKDAALAQKEQDTIDAKQRADQAEADARRDLQSVQSSQRTLEAEVERLKRTNEALQRDHDAELNRVQGELRSQIAQARLEARTNSENMQQQHSKEMDRLRGEQGANLASERSLWEDKTRKAAEQASRELSQALEKAQSEHKSAVEQTKQFYASELDELKKTHAQKVQELRAKVTQHETTIGEKEAAVADARRELHIEKQGHTATRTELETLQSTHEDVSNARDQLTNELQTAKRLQEDLQQLNTKAMARVKTLEEEAKAREARIKALTEEKEKLQAEQTETASKIKDLEQEVEGQQSELAAERKGYGELETELGDVKAKLAKAEKEVKDAAVSTNGGGKGKGNKNKGGNDDEKVKALEKQLLELKSEVEKEKEEAKKARSELDDMLMVMSDLEGERDGYRERLKKLGEEVSEDEEDEDEDEDGEGDEEDGEGELD